MSGQDCIPIIAMNFFSSHNSSNMRNAALFSILIAAISFQRLQAQEWVRQHPFEVLEPIKDVAMAPNGHGIAVGNKSTVRYTTDYGAHWLVSENIPPYQTLDKVAIFPDGQGNTAIATNNSKLYKTTDGGVNWQTLPDPPSIGGYRYFSTPAADAIYIAGNSGVLKSLDKGDSWTVVSPAGATGINWTSISFVDTAKGWLGGQNGQVYRTTDGGANWTQVADGQLDNRVTLDFLNATTGYAGVHRKLFKTTDGGQNWTLMLPTAFGSHISDLEIIDQNRFVASQGNRTFYSADGGVSVTLVRPTPYSYENFGVSALADGQVWVASTYTAIAHSTDSGASYTDQIPGNKNALGVIRFTDQQNGWACGYGKTVLRTTDGGAHWTDISIDDPDLDNDIYDAYAFSKDELWVCGRSFILRTTDGGNSWENLYDYDALFTSLAVTPNRIYATDWNGNVHRSLDQGATWQVTTAVTLSTNLEKVFFLDDMNGYTVGWNGTVSKTTDGGDNWTLLTLPVTDRLIEAFFLNEQTGWVAMDKFSTEILFTQDGGATWDYMTAPAGTYWNNIRWDDAMTGYLAGGSAGFGMVFRTTDGGANWEQLHMSNQAALGFEAVTWDASTRFWICGTGGNIESATYQPTRTDEPFANNQMSVFPNPATTGAVNLELPESFYGQADLEVFTADGKPIRRQKARQTLGLDGLAPGLYLIRVTMEQKRYFGKVVVM